jgi:hypothetical protein
MKKFTAQDGSLPPDDENIMLTSEGKSLAPKSNVINQLSSVSELVPEKLLAYIRPGKRQCWRLYRHRAAAITPSISTAAVWPFKLSGTYY